MSRTVDLPITEVHETRIRPLQEEVTQLRELLLVADERLTGIENYGGEPAVRARRARAAIAKAEGTTHDMPARPYRVCCHHIDHDDVEGPIGYGRHGAINAWNRRAPFLAAPPLVKGGKAEAMLSAKTALKAMMAHSGIRDAAPEDKDEEDHLAERLAIAAIAALSASPAPVQSEPVGWRCWDNILHGHFSFTDSAEHAAARAASKGPDGSHAWNVQPLYLHPYPSDNRVAELERDHQEERDGYASLLSIVAMIREKSGVGAGPMLTDLPDAIEAKFAELQRLKALPAEPSGVREALQKIVDFCDDPNGSAKVESLALGLARLLPIARSALSLPSEAVTDRNALAAAARNDALEAAALTCRDVGALEAISACCKGGGA